MENYQTENTQKKEEIRQGGKQEQLRQRELVRAFDEKLHSYVSNGMEPVEKLGKGFFLVFMAMVMFLPFDMEETGLWIMLFGFGVWPVSIALMSKINVTENGKQKSIYQKLKYLPVDKKEIWHVRIEYVVKFLKTPIIVALVAQVIGAWAFNGRIGIENIIYPLVAQGLIPLLFGLLMAFEIEIG